MLITDRFQILTQGCLSLQKKQKTHPYPQNTFYSKTQKEWLNYSAKNLRLSKSVKREIECKSVIRAFVRGSLPGLSRLKCVLPNIFLQFKVGDTDDQMRILTECGLHPVVDTAKNQVTFDFSLNE